jgi:hypothetical protein
MEKTDPEKELEGKESFLKTALKLNPERLAVLQIGGVTDEIIGEVLENGPGYWEGILDDERTLYVKNPRKIVQVRQMTKEGLSIDTVMMDFDLFDPQKTKEAHVIEVRPVMAYWYKHLPIGSKLALHNLFENYAQMKKVEYSSKPKVILPERKSPFAK